MALNRIEFRKTLGKVGAVLMIGTMMIFTFTGCAQTQTNEPTAVIQEVEETQEKGNGGNIANDIDFSVYENEQKDELAEQITEEEISKLAQEVEDYQNTLEDYTVSFEGAANEDITVKEKDAAEIPEFEAESAYDVISRQFSESFDVSSDGVFYNGELLSKDYEEVEGRIVVKNVSFTEKTHYQVHYVVENNKVVAKDIIENEGESGISFVIDKDENVLVGLQDIKGTDISDLKVNLGKVIGWSSEKGTHQVEVNFKDEIELDSDLVLYPVYEQRMVTTDANGNQLDSDGKVIEIEVRDGKLNYVGTESKEVNDNGEVVDKKAETKKSTDNSSKKSNDGSSKKTDNKGTEEQQATQPTQSTETTQPTQQENKPQETTESTKAPADGDPYNGDTSVEAGAAAWGVSGEVDWGAGGYSEAASGWTYE